MQNEVNELTIRTDADWAGCRRARKSTSGGSISRGTHCIKTWSKTQAVIAKSSAESELYGVVRAACEALGTKTMFEDLDEPLGIVLEFDATAAKGILDRTGLAKDRQIVVNCLWIQEQCAKKRVPLIKNPGEHDSAELLIKHVTQLVIKRHLDSLFLDFKDGRTDKAAKHHSVTRIARQESAAAKLHNVDGSFASVPGECYWAERGEAGRWVRDHTHPKTSAFLPWRVSG